MMPQRVIVTGASGFLGRHLLAALKDRCRIFALARRSQRRVRVPNHPNISWHQVDIGEAEPLAAVFREIRNEGGAEVLVHLAAYYDFTGENNPEYRRTNVAGLRNVLELAQTLALKRFVFASSVAACRFPADGASVTEASPPDADHAYGRSKRAGEEMVAAFRDRFPICTVRLAALFSDWCEYPPLFMLLATWTSGAWNRRLLAGKGASAIPYLHVRDAVGFFLRLLERHDELDRAETLVASPDGATSHARLFDEATRSHFGKRVAPAFVPKPVARSGLLAMDLAGRFLGRRPFERPWMGRYIDLRLSVDASRTRRRLGWAPHPRLDIARRMPFLVDGRKADPVEWHRRNWAAMKGFRLSGNLRIHQLLDAHQDEIIVSCLEGFLGDEAAVRFPGYLAMETEDLEWAIIQTFRHLKNAVRTREKAIFRACCHDLARRRFRQGFRCEEVCDALDGVRERCLAILAADPAFGGLEEDFHDYVEMTVRLGIDEIQDVFEELSGASLPAG